MKIITGKIGTGKTIEVIKQAHIKRLTIVVGKKYWADYLAESANRLGYSIPPPICYEEFRSLEYGNDKDNKYFIDNIEEFLLFAFPKINIKGFTCEGENVTIMEKLSEGFFKRELI